MTIMIPEETTKLAASVRLSGINSSAIRADGARGARRGCVHNAYPRMKDKIKIEYLGPCLDTSNRK